MSDPDRMRIPPVPEGGRRPRWSVMIPTFNCAALLREALDGVLAQDPGDDVMQIEVVDDCSDCDDPQRCVDQVGGGRVAFFRQPRNVGHIENLCTCLLRARGHLVHLLHGDDMVLPDFYRRMEQPFDAHPEVGAAFCRHIFVDEAGREQSVGQALQSSSGIVQDWLETIATGQRLQTPAMVVRRKVYERLGGFDRRAGCAEDWEMWVRIAAHFSVWYEATPLVRYRIRASSLYAGKIRTGANLRDLRQVIAINRELLPDGRAASLSRQAEINCALGGLRRARWLLDAGDHEAAQAQARAALECSWAWPVVREWARLLGHSLRPRRRAS